MANFIDHNYDTAAEFLAALRLSDPSWWPYTELAISPDRNWQRDWIFRGEASTTNPEWTPLVPKAWRIPRDRTLDISIRDLVSNNDVKLELVKCISNRQFLRPFDHPGEEEQAKLRSHLSSVILHAFAELSLVAEFGRLADEVGLSASQIPMWTRTYEFICRYADMVSPPLKVHVTASEGPFNTTSHVLENAQQNEPSIWQHPAIALAQHHGIPTRLLDWTRNPLAAAYFAANSADANGHDRLAVYAVHRQMLRGRLVSVDVPFSFDDYLRAQLGVLTVDLKADEFFVAYGRFPTFIDSLGLVPGIYEKIIHPKRFILPTTEASELLRLLWLERVTQAHVMPTLDNVASAVKTKLRIIGEQSKGSLQ